MSAFLELAAQRYSLRQYRNRPVEPEKLAAVLKAAELAPTGCNVQPQRLLVADDPAVLAKIRECTAYQFSAPVTIVACYDRKACWYNAKREPLGPVDVSIVVSYMQLEAAAQGLGTCWVASFDADKLCRVLNIPEDFVPMALLPLGYAADNVAPGPMHFRRRPASEFAFRNHF